MKVFRIDPVSYHRWDDLIAHHPKASAFHDRGWPQALARTYGYTLFHLLNKRSIDLWKTHVKMILAKNGLASIIIHSDYITEPDTRSVYESLLGWLRDLRDQQALWFALPSEINFWWRARSQMSVVKDGKSGRIEGEGSERAVLAFAKDDQGKLVRTG